MGEKSQFFFPLFILLFYYFTSFNKTKRYNKGRVTHRPELVTSQSIEALLYITFNRARSLAFTQFAFIKLHLFKTTNKYKPQLRLEDMLFVWSILMTSANVANCRSLSFLSRQQS